MTGKLLDLSLTSSGGEGLEAWTGGGAEKIFLLNKYVYTRRVYSFVRATDRPCFYLPFSINRSNILAGVAGITSDANSLVNYARTAAQKHLFSYDEEIPVEMLAQRLCDLKQGYTQYGGEL